MRETKELDQALAKEALVKPKRSAELASLRMAEETLAAQKKYFMAFHDFVHHPISFFVCPSGSERLSRQKMQLIVSFVPLSPSLFPSFLLSFFLVLLL
jgi:hypothetical protein